MVAEEHETEQVQINKESFVYLLFVQKFNLADCKINANLLFLMVLRQNITEIMVC